MHAGTVTPPTVITPSLPQPLLLTLYLIEVHVEDRSPSEGLGAKSVYRKEYQLGTEITIIL